MAFSVGSIATWHKKGNPIAVAHCYHAFANTHRVHGGIDVGASEDNVRTKLTDHDKGLARGIGTSRDCEERYTEGIEPVVRRTG